VVLVALQVSLGFVLMAGSVLMMKTFWNLEHVNPGFDRKGVAEVIVGPQAAGYSAPRSAIFMTELERRIAMLPGVRSEASAWSDVMRGVGMKMTVAPAGVVLPKNTFLNTNANVVSKDYFATLGIPLLAGRNLEPGDDNKRPQPMVVNTAFADKFFPHQSPIGKFIVFYATDGRATPSGMIVGLAGTAKYRSLREENPPIAYTLTSPGVGTVAYARTAGDPARAIGSIRGLVREMDARVPIAEAMTMEEKVENTLWQERLVMVLASFFGVVALVLAAVGIYGALDYAVAARRREIGIRMAVGAVGRDIVRTVGGGIAVAVGIGTGIGLLAAKVALSGARKLLFGVDLLDPVVLSLTLGAVLACAVAAAMVPVFRAIKTDPVKALRME
jgi:predicted permease